MTHVCKYEEVIPRIDKRLDEIDKKLDKTLSFKWIITGGFIAISGVCGVALTLFEIYTKTRGM